MQSPFVLPVIRQALSGTPLVVIDVGAKGGVVAPWTQPGAGHLVRTFGFEPSPVDFAALRSSENISYFQMAISDRPGRANFFAHSGAGSLLERADRKYLGETYQEIEVEVETLENLVRRGTIDRPDVIKTDVERYDLRAVRGAGPYLDDALAVVCEFEFYNTDHDNSFSSIDRLLTSHGMLLFGLSLKNGSLGEIGGGDLLYVRDVGALLSREMPASEKRTQFLKLFVIAAILKNPRYVRVLCELGRQAGMIDDAEYRELSDFVDSNVYLPFAMPAIARKFRGRLAHMLSLAAQLVAGQDVGVKSAPSSNMFTTYNHAYINRRWVPRAFRDRFRETTDIALQAYGSMKGVYYAPMPTPPKKD